jgi:hypothetical protein
MKRYELYSSDVFEDCLIIPRTNLFNTITFDPKK